MNNLLLLTAICSAKQVKQSDVAPVDLTTVDTLVEDLKPVVTPNVGGGEDQKIPLQDSFKVMGPINGVCSSEFNSHPMVMKDPLDTTKILGKWNTALVDSEILERMFVPLCMTAEFAQLDGQEELVMRVGELHSLKDDVANKEVFAFSGQTMTLLFDNIEVPTIANQYSFSPSNKFSQFLDLGIPDVLVTMTCM